MSAYSAINGDAEGHIARPASASSSIRAKRNRSRGKENGVAGQASWISSVINLVNTIIGAGVLAMPLALSRMGILLGTFIILWSGLTAGFGLYLQTRCAKYLDRGSASFFALSQITYPNAAVIFDFAIAIKCFGVGVSYLIIIGDLMPGVVLGFSENAASFPFLVDRHFWVTGFMLVVIPLSFLRRLDSLKYTSVIALISIGYLVILVVAHFFKGDTMAERGPIRFVRWQSAIATLSSFPVIMFSILNEIADNSHFRTTSVVTGSIGSAAFLYILVAITGYLSFGNNVAGNIVGMYPPSVTATIGKAAIVVLVMFSYPLQVHPCRASVDAVLKWRPRGSGKGSSSSNSSPARAAPLLPPSNHTTGQGGRRAGGDTMGDTRFAAITTAIIVLSYIVAMTVSSLEKVLAYVGSTGSTSISFILPGLFYYKISSPNSPLHQRLMKEDDDEESDGVGGGGGGDEDEGLLGGVTTRLKGPSWRKAVLRKLSLALAIYGLVVMVTCLVTNTFFIVAH
ncbi:hypothetical protein MMC09_003733 [Bachmanniomyces sp. S44760]|nr:hypothetical protein [Bachmanniomyces sp. S44760]